MVFNVYGQSYILAGFSLVKNHHCIAIVFKERHMAWQQEINRFVPLMDRHF